MKNLITILCLCSFLFSNIIEVSTKDTDGNIIIEYYKKHSLKKELLIIKVESYYPNKKLNYEENYKDGKLIE